MPSDEKTWSVTFDGMQFKNGPKLAIKSERIMLDTGVTYALVPKEDVNALAKALMGFSINCQAPENFLKLGTFSCSGCTEGNYKSLKPI